MKYQIEVIFNNCENITVLSRAKEYSSHIKILCEEIQCLEKRISELEEGNKFQVDNSTATKAIEEIRNILETNGYLPGPPVG